MDRRAAMGRRDYQDAWDIAMACAGIPAGGDQATQEGDGIRKGVKWINAWERETGTKHTWARLVRYEDGSGIRLYWNYRSSYSVGEDLAEWARRLVRQGRNMPTNNHPQTVHARLAVAGGILGKPDWSWTATATEETYEPASVAVKHTPPQRVAQKTITPYVAKMVRGHRHLVPIYKDINTWIREQGDEMVRHEVKTRHSIPLCECGEPMHVVAEVKETANDCQRMVVIQIKCVVTD